MHLITAAPLSRHHMPADYRISLASYTGRGTQSEKRIPGDFGPAQPMQDFDPVYRNIIDYIVRITYRIWEDRDVEYIRETYHENSLVFDDYGLQRGAEKIVRDTRHTTGAFSDIKLIADEIVWAGDDRIGYHTSHRTIIRGTNDGPSKYGAATHKPIDVWCIANCVALGNKIFLEHVLYNNSSLLIQLGMDPKETALKLAEAQPSNGRSKQEVFASLRAAARPEKPLFESAPVAGFDVDAFLRHHVDSVWNRRDFTSLNSNCNTDLAFHGPTGRSSIGRDAYRDFIGELLAAFPDIDMQVDEVYWMGSDANEYITSLRWAATGTHRGHGIYGAPTGKTVRIWGITQNKIIGGRIVENWTMFNELELMMQIYGHNR